MWERDNVRQWSSNGVPASDGGIEYIAGREYRIINQNSNRALGVPDGVTAGGESLQQFAWWTKVHRCGKSIDNSDGTYHTQNVNSGTVVGVSDNSTTDGADVIQ